MEYGGTKRDGVQFSFDLGLNPEGQPEVHTKGGVNYWSSGKHPPTLLVSPSFTGDGGLRAHLQPVSLWYPLFGVLKSSCFLPVGGKDPGRSENRLPVPMSTPPLTPFLPPRPYQTRSGGHK